MQRPLICALVLFLAVLAIIMVMETRGRARQVKMELGGGSSSLPGGSGSGSGSGDRAPLGWTWRAADDVEVASVLNGERGTALFAILQEGCGACAALKPALEEVGRRGARVFWALSRDVQGTMRAYGLTDVPHVWLSAPPDGASASAIRYKGAFSADELMRFFLTHETRAGRLTLA